MTSITRINHRLGSVLILGLVSAVAGMAGCDADVSTSTTGSPTGTDTGTGTGTGSGTASGVSDGGGGGGVGGLGGAGGAGGAGGGSAFACGDMGLMCNAPQICLETVMTTGPMNDITWSCEDDPCAPNALDCACAMSLCQGPATCSIDMGVVVCQSGGVCAHPDTPILTPDGERPIAELQVGDLVVSRHRGALRPVPLLRATKTRVQNHAVVEVTLASGRTMLVSAGHPDADGRLFGDLEVGSTLGGERVTSLATRSYEESHTYDILPDSDTGTYVAAGALIGSTLR